VWLEGFLGRGGEPLPLIVRKSDGGYMYASTDLAAVRHRTAPLSGGGVQGGEGADRVLYVTDVGQAGHFAQVGGWGVGDSPSCFLLLLVLKCLLLAFSC